MGQVTATLARGRHWGRAAQGAKRLCSGGMVERPVMELDSNATQVMRTGMGGVPRPCHAAQVSFEELEIGEDACEHREHRMESTTPMEAMSSRFAATLVTIGPLASMTCSMKCLSWELPCQHAMS